MSAAASLRDAFLRGLPPIPALYPGPPPTQAPVAAARPAPLLPPAQLADYLERYYARLYPGQGAQPAVAAQLARLRLPGAVTVTTGQQPALFGGPLYNLYKAVGAVAHARRLEAQQPGAVAVPVFWLAGEDHDAQELNHTYAAFDHRLTYNGPWAGAVGRHVIQDAIRALGAPADHPLVGHFAPGVRFADAFARTLDHLLGPLGLVILDPDAPELKAAFAPLMERELLERPTYGAVARQSEVLAQAGLPVQLHARPINLFYLTDTARERIAPHGSDFRLVGSERVLARAHLLAQLATHPERFSPNAALRPLYQEAILPNVGYVGGWGELAYWLQLGAVFRTFGLPYPQLRPRPAALLLHHSQYRALQDTGLTLSQLLQPDADLRRLLADRLWPAQQQGQLADLSQAFDALYGQLADHLAQYHPSLGRTGHSLAARQRRLMSALPAKIRRQLLAQHPQSWRPVLALKHAIQPDGQVQERTLGLVAFPPDVLQAVARFLLDAEALHSDVFTARTLLLAADGSVAPCP